MPQSSQGISFTYDTSQMVSGLSENALQQPAFHQAYISQQVAQQAPSYLHNGQIPLLGSVSQVQPESQGYLGPQQLQQVTGYQQLPPQNLGPVLYTLQGVRLDGNLQPVQQQPQHQTILQGNVLLPSCSVQAMNQLSQGHFQFVRDMAQNHPPQQQQQQIRVQNAVFGGSDGQVPLLQSQLISGHQLQLLPLNNYSSSDRASQGSDVQYAIIHPNHPNQGQILMQQGQVNVFPELMQGGGVGSNAGMGIGLQHELKTRQYLKEARDKLKSLHAQPSNLNASGRGGPQQPQFPEQTNIKLAKQPFSESQIHEFLSSEKQHRIHQQVAAAFDPPDATSFKSQTHLGRSSEGAAVKFSRHSYLQGSFNCNSENGDGDEDDYTELKSKFPPLSLNQLVKDSKHANENSRLTTQEKNRNAQRRFRERQKERVTQLEGDVNDLRQQLSQMAKANVELSSINVVLEQSLKLHETGSKSVALNSPGQSGLLSIATAVEGQSLESAPSSDQQVQGALASITDLQSLIAFWKDGVKSLVVLLVKTESGISVPPQAVQISQAMTDLSVKLGKTRPDLIRLLASIHLESRDALVGACESTTQQQHGSSLKDQPNSLTPVQQHWRAVLKALGAGVSDDQKLSLMSANERYLARLGPIMEERSNLLSSCLFDPMQDPSMLLSVATSHLTLPAPFKSTIKFQAAVDSFKANLHEEYLAYAELDGLVTRMILSPEQVAHARCLSYPVPLDALGLAESVTQVDGKKLLSKSVEAKIAAVHASIQCQPQSASNQVGQQSSGLEGDDVCMEGSDEGLDDGEDNKEMEEEEGRGG